MEKELKVQVVCVTYNHKDYIGEALDSFLMQKTNFKFEVLVGDNGSTDGTSEIVAEYAQKYPDIIKHFRREPNIGCLENFMDLCDRVTAPYAAFCDGDDYWVDENKLQTQYDFMEANADVNICCHKTKIQADESWSLYEHYLKQKEPFVIPQENRAPAEKKLTVANVINEWPHTSSFFIRWDKKVKIPENLKKDGIMGDMPLVFLYLGEGHLYVINKIMSFYRRHKNGVFYSNVSQTDFFLQTKLEYFKVFTTIIEYFKDNYHSAHIACLEARLLREIENYINAIVKEDRWDLLIKLKEEYPDVYWEAKRLIREYRARLTFLKCLGRKNVDLLKDAKVLKRYIKPYLSLIRRNRKTAKSIEKAFYKGVGFVAYWLFALVPKKKNLWVFSGFKKMAYMDNSKYFYEYCVQNHPEIQAVWLTKNAEVKKHLQENKMPVYRMNSFKGFWTMIRANLAFSDHFKMSDYSPRYGWNARTKLVQLWHGSGLKDMRARGDTIPNTTVPGARLSSDIIIDKQKDSLLVKIRKSVKYIFLAPFRELYEQYYAILCPSDFFVEMFAGSWKTPEKSHIKCGFPRNDILCKKVVNDKRKIIYAPTYRWKPVNEVKIIDNFIEALPRLNAFLEKSDSEFVLRLHPHTWRNYETKIESALRKYPRITRDHDKDVYAVLNTYSILITDYSSIICDFMLTNNRVIHFPFDYEDLTPDELSFNLPYFENCAGPVAYTWDDLIKEMGACFDGPNKYEDDYVRMREKYFASPYGGANSSERLVSILKQDLAIK